MFLSLIVDTGKFLVISDSIAKHVKLSKAVVEAYPGDTINRLKYRLELGEVVVTGCARVLVHVGTNDLSNMLRRKNFSKVTIHAIIGKYRTLYEVVRRLEPNALIIFSSILPRTKGNRVMKPYVQGVNFALEKMCAQSQGRAVYLPSFKWFLEYGQPVKEFFAKRDGLHLRAKGTLRLAQCFTQAFSTGYLVNRLGKKRTRKLANLRY